MPGSEFTFRADDGQTLLGRRWLPEGRTRAIVQIAHGLAEHSARYARLAARAQRRRLRRLTPTIIAATGQAGADDLGHFADEGGWDKVVGDLDLNRLIAAEQPGAPISSSAIRWARSSGAPSSPSTRTRWPASPFRDRTASRRRSRRWGGCIAREERLRLGKRGKSELIFKMWFGEFNKPFRPARTAFDWLSRDEKEVDAYVADPFCGFPFTTSSRSTCSTRCPRSEPARASRRSARTWPSTSSPASAIRSGANIQGLIADLEGAGFTKLTTRIYPGARHETLNETNRDEVTRDLIAWLDGVVGK